MAASWLVLQRPGLAGHQVMTWPVAHTYAHQDRARISMPVGGIGTGTVGFGGRGQLRDWELENHPAVGLAAPLTFFACHVSSGSGSSGSGSPGSPGASGSPGSSGARVLEGA